MYTLLDRNSLSKLSGGNATGDEVISVLGEAEAGYWLCGPWCATGGAIIGGGAMYWYDHHK
jgi:hypothetical protein